MSKKKRMVQPIALPSPSKELPLREVVVQLAAKTRRLGELDTAIAHKLGAIERVLRRHRSGGIPVDVPFAPWGKLGWSGRRDRPWRLVVVDEDACEDLRSMPRECRAEACMVLGKLVARLGLPPRR